MERDMQSTGDAGMEEQLWNYIDGTASAEKRNMVEKLILADEQWRSKYNELIELDQILKSSELESPSMRFTKNVMEEIAKFHIAPATKTYINKKVIWSIGFFFIALFIGFLVYGFGQMAFTGGEQSSISKSLSKVDFSKFFNNTWINIFMMINVVLGLVLLDHYLSKRLRAKRQG